MIKSRRMGWAGHVVLMGDKKRTYRDFVGKPEGNRPVRRHRRRWIDIIKIYFREIGWGVMDWTDLAQNRPVEGSCEHSNELSCTIK
jgi:hypothetical protein